MNISRIISSNLDLAWNLLSELVRPVVFYKITGYTMNGAVGETRLATAAVDALVVSYQSRDVDGQSIVNGDEKWLVRNSDLASISPLPASGDWFQELGIRFDIIAALRDASHSVWTFQVRRQALDPAASADGSEDWGSLSAHTSTEDWGDLSLHDGETDWMN